MTTDRHKISPYPVRMEDELRQKLEDSASAEGRSLHAEIIRRLEISFAGENSAPVETTNNAMFAPAATLTHEIGYTASCARPQQW